MICLHCGEEKSEEDFPPYNSKRYGKERRPVCRTCHNKRARKYFNERYKDKEARKEKQRDWGLKTRYGISLDEYKDMYSRQGGRCAICEEQYDTLAIDHCHQSGKVRSLLCTKCNTGLGAFNDNISLLDRAKEYVISHSKE